MSQKTQLLTVTEVSDMRQDKNGRNYKLVTFQGPQHVEIVDETTGEILLVRVPARTSSMTRYEESYLDDKAHYMFDAVVGEKVPGAIVTREVPAYEIDGRATTSYSTIVLGMTNEPSFEAKVRAAFKSAGHILEGAEEVEAQAESLPRVSATKAKAEVEVSEEIEF